MPLEEFIEAVTDPLEEVPTSEFIEISDLSPSELGVFARAWFTMPGERRQWTVSTMVELAEDSPELDFSAVFKMFLRDDDEFVLEKAIEGLWEYEDRSVIPSLLGILQSDRTAAVRAAAAGALGKFSVLIQEGKLLPKDADAIHETLMGVLEDDYEPMEVRRRCLEAVAPFNTEDIEGFVRWAYDSSDLELKCSSIFAMGRTGEISWLPLVIQEMDNEEPSVRYETANACGELGEEDLVPYLVALLQDDDYQVQLAGVAALGKIGGGMAKRALQRCIQEGDAALEDAAQSALEEIDFLDDPVTFTSDI